MGRALAIREFVIRNLQSPIRNSADVLSSVTAISKFPCPACGAQAEWNPGKEKLVCPFCGTESPYQIDRVDRADPGAGSGQDAARAA